MSDTEFDWGSVTPADEFHEMALTAYHEGESFPAIESLLRRSGLASELMPAVIDPLAQSRATFYFSLGKTPAQVIELFCERGLERYRAETIAREIGQKREHQLTSQGMGRWQQRSMALGGVMIFSAFMLAALRQLGVDSVPRTVIYPLGICGFIISFLGGVRIRPPKWFR